MKAMKTIIGFTAVMLLTATSVVLAQSAVEKPENAYLDGVEPTFNAQEREALKLAKQWKSTDKAELPIIGPDGSVTYYFGVSQPVLICAPLEVCIIKLQPGETVTAIHAGDTTRWLISPALVGTPNGESQTHIVVKPTQVGLVTTLYVGTDRRSYNIKLKSSRTEFIPFLAFNYPLELDAVWTKYRDKVDEQKKRETIATTSQKDLKEISKLDFEYSIQGDAKWRPVRVYNDGEKTIIQMPTTMKQTEAPTLLVVDQRGNEQLVNYRLQEDRFIVDQVFGKAALIAGVGHDQQRVVITRKL